jgi:ribosomal protein S18 acetylase RimI-like enzyme
MFRMAIEPAKISDLERIFTIYQRCAAKLNAEGIRQWLEHYPSRTLLQEDIYAGEMFKYVTDSKITAVIVLTEKQEKAYEAVKWRHRDGKVIVAKRLAVDPEFQMRGIASGLMVFAEDYAAKNGYASIRLEAYCGHTVALNFYRNRNYQEVGEVHFPGRELPFKCFEKKL